MQLQTIVHVLVAEGSLDEVVTALAEAGIESTPIEERSTGVYGPDGRARQINEHGG